MDEPKTRIQDGAEAAARARSGLPLFVMLDMPRADAGAQQGSEPSQPIRPAFPILTVVGTIGLILFVALTIIRNHQRDAATASAGSSDKALTQEIADGAASPPASATPAQVTQPRN